jgi:uncharacterized membrane protein YgdD (TMEM256/DUF423 family)
MARRFQGIAALLAGLAVMAGAFGTHALTGQVPPERMATFETAARYQMYHALALWGVGAVLARQNDRRMRLAGMLFGAGILLFCGSLYALVLTDLSWLGAVTPLGGLAFIAGWLVLAWALWRPHTTDGNAA